ncbi:hypothetical protein [Lactiplantibacillus mudanjiangensis]|uniref:Uncharacterized protein n=1 Tax=Lactiplantibacillus mudanjiangensis TaxID=1296538 RepID=A0A660E1R2_9LACO|nr:hypothetical protein [Lactiplantibacillus mudanjiangensis]VDG18402.1 hypothetical protein MUDAN_BIHEEGNE_03281 [Lactiplantibacillus mudanjiangensis]VDG25057.1 hypothetical protein MUDAN_IGPPGNFN_03037 [Lactiplantibacillus mudanjiangensis]VDG29668.1 hypothetical protein MUDAN_MDHGFNIF_01205 [Lactiplantibacillus mudanjiangensis]VDG33662.1 hypothetical protein MUDAN_DOGOELCO_02803 [Lactiplantibacillus mudanjiangensis]
MKFIDEIDEEIAPAFEDPQIMQATIQAMLESDAISEATKELLRTEPIKEVWRHNMQPFVEEYYRRLGA